MYKKFAALSLAGLVVFIACKKSDSSTPPPPKPIDPVAADSAALLGKWTLTAENGAVYSSGVFVDSGHTDVNGSGDYWAFDGKKVIAFENDVNNNFQPSFDTSYYKVMQGHYLLATNGPALTSDTFRILTLTADTLVIAEKYIDSSYFSSGYGIGMELDTFRFKK